MDKTYTVGFGGKVTVSHKESQKVWWKPWTWLRKPVTVIDELDVSEISIMHAPADRDSTITATTRFEFDMEMEQDHET